MDIDVKRLPRGATILNGNLVIDMATENLADVLGRVQSIVVDAGWYAYDKRCTTQSRLLHPAADTALAQLGCDDLRDGGLYGRVGMFGELDIELSLNLDHGVQAPWYCVVYFDGEDVSPDHCGTHEDPLDAIYEAITYVRRNKDYRCGAFAQALLGRLVAIKHAASEGP